MPVLCGGWGCLQVTVGYKTSAPMLILLDVNLCFIVREITLAGHTGCPAVWCFHLNLQEHSQR